MNLYLNFKALTVFSHCKNFAKKDKIFDVRKLKFTKGEKSVKNPNGYGSIVKMGGNRRKPFGVRITVGIEKGKQIYKYLGYFEKRSEAMVYLAEYNKNPYDLDTVNITFKEVYERYIKDDVLSTASLKARKTAFNHCAPLYDKPFRSLKKSHMQSLINDIESVSSKNLIAILFHKMFAYALDNDIVHKDYSASLIVPSKNRKSEKTVFKDEEIAILWENRGNINADILLILLYSGMRIGELLNLKKEKIHLDEDYLIAGSKTKAGKDRYIPIHKKTKHIFEEYMNSNDTPYLLVTRYGKPIRYDSYQRKRFAPLMKRLGMNHTIHETRHTAITKMSNASGNRLAIKRIVGHSDETTDGYTHIDRNILHKTINLIN